MSNLIADVRACVLAVLVACSACSDRTPATPALASVEPQQAPNAVETPVRILGDHFYPLVTASFDDQDESAVKADFAARLQSSERGTDHSLREVELVSVRELAAIVPSGLPAGMYDLLVVDPRGRQGRLEDAFQVIDPTLIDGGADSGPDGAPDGGSDTATPDVTADAPSADAPTGDAPPADGPPADAPPADAPQADAPLADLLSPDLPPDGPLPCPPTCINGCAGGLCTIDCSAGACSCPPGWDCEVSCQSSGDCLGDIDCAQAASCNVDCQGGSCIGNINCQGSSCTITCDGGSCAGNITCSGDCAIECSGGSCQGNVTCTGQCLIDCKDHSCNGDVICTGGPCTINCTSNACQSIDCASTCACSATCISNSCLSGLSCPAGCLQAGACVTTPPQCDTC